MAGAPAAGRRSISGFYDPQTPPAHGINRGPARKLTDWLVTALPGTWQLLPEAGLPLASRGTFVFANRLADRDHLARRVGVAVWLHRTRRLRDAARFHFLN